MRFLSLLSATAIVAGAAAQGGAYDQCGGQDWTGPTTCVSGYYCYYYSEYYSQCIPGTASSVASSSTATSSPVPTGNVFTSYAKVSGSIFEINGERTYFAGTNSYWIGFLTDNSDVDLVMSNIASSGLKVLRVWGFNDVNTLPSEGTVWFQSFITGESPVINTGEYGLERLDYVVQAAEAYGVSLIINFVNNWDNYGGMQAYCTYYNISDVTDWYTSADAQEQYQAYIAAVVSRYLTSKAVFSWELANEPRCTGCSTSVIQEWATTTSAYIKSLDPNHMVTLGEEGFGLYSSNDTSYPFTDGPGTNFTENILIPDIDFGTYHLYPSSWGETDSWGPSWISDHAAAAAAVGKPVIAEEYGSLTLLDEVPWQDEILDTETAGDLFWQYGDVISTGQTPNDGYAIYYGTADYTILVLDHAAAMNAKAV